ncbi:beta-ketoacyl synthase N-terminal-like domain-containing protein [Nocardia sp. NBC_01009]|uniref:type I polyketide synthase n=1 Tax=Nocardia sp. NBC_01009 TaxID=2975996 RepID=UPI003867EAA1|nr:phosphopantetheine-binding protein [Nocardia sp. NBC_01009]
MKRKKPQRRTNLDQATTAQSAQPIAVVGMSCRFAGGADSPEALWRLLIGEVDAVADAPPAGRWPSGSYHDTERDAPGKTVSIAGAYLPDVELFDAEFFGITPRETADMDPQQRLALELSWEAFEDAGIRPDAVPDTGVYFANKFNDYRAVKLRRGPAATTPFTSTGDVEGIIANRVSYFLGFDGPSMTVNASCAGSLVAVHLACQSLRAGESAVAVAGGVQLNLIPDTAIGLSKLGVLAPGGRSRAFDATADGYVRGEGGAVVVLKPLSAALRDGDRIYCTVLGSATNNNGRHHPGTASDGAGKHSMPASSPAGQEQLLRRACARAGVDPSTVDYVEAHGTGTAVGDRAELTALGAVYGAARRSGTALTVGSVKTNIGHTEAAAGMAGLLKVALALRHRQIPRSLHFDHPAADLDLAAASIRVANTLLPWPEREGPARAGVSAFGFGGSNAHVIVEEVAAEIADGPPQNVRATSSETELRYPERLIVLSARTEPALREQVRRLRDHLSSHPGITLEDLAHTLCRTRKTFAQRLSLVATTMAEVNSFLNERLGDTAPIGVSTETADASQASALVVAAALRPGTVPRHRLLQAVGALFERGVDPDWSALAPPGHVVSLPTYPFQRQRHWAIPTETEPMRDLRSESTVVAGNSTQDHGRGHRVGRAALSDTVAKELAEVVGVTPDHIGRTRNFDQLGVGSVHAVELSSRLAARLGITIPAAIIWGHPTVELLTAELSTRLEATNHPAAPPTIGARELPDSIEPALAARPPRTSADEEVLSTAELLALGHELLG